MSFKLSKKSFLQPSAILVFAVTNFCSVAFAATTITTETDKLSYSIGASLGKDFQQQQINVNPELVSQGIKDGLSNKLVLSAKEIQTVLANFQETQMKKQELQLKEVATKNRNASQEFLEKNKKAKGVVTLPSGLQYKIIKQGSGKNPTVTDTVTVNYKGTLINGTEFDSSYSKKEPATFKLSDVIKGWQEGIQLMQPGGKIQLFIPPALAYGDRSVANIIEPNSVLIFEVELLKVGNETTSTESTSTNTKKAGTPGKT